jgi:hypothetical protein
MPKKKLPVVIQVFSNGQPIGTVETSDFLAAINAPKNMFLSDAVEKFNAHKVAIGEPERAVLELRKNVKKAS